MKDGKFKQDDFKNPEELIEYLYAIIDTKIQYMEYQSRIVTGAFVDIDKLDLNSKSNTLGGGLELLETIMISNGRILEKIQEYSATTKLLLILRNQLNKNNAIPVLELLTDNKFTQLTDKELNIFIKKATFELENKLR